MKKLIIALALIFLTSVSYAQACWKVQGVIKLNTQSQIVEAYLNDDNTDMEGINLTRMNKELSVVSRDDKTLTINMFYATLAKAQVIYDYLVGQAGDMLYLDDGKSKVCLLNTTNDEKMATRRSGDKLVNSFTKE